MSIEDVYDINNRINNIYVNISKDYIPRITVALQPQTSGRNDLTHIITLCENWAHEDNLNELMIMRNNLINDIKKDIKDQLLSILNTLN